MIVQFFIGSTGILNTPLPAQCAGKCRIRLISLQNTMTANPAVPLVLTLNSDTMFNSTPLSGRIFFISQLQSYYGNNFMYYATLGAQVSFTILDSATGIAPVNFSSCLLTFDIEPIN